MKKVLLIGLTVAATFALTGCEMVEKLLKGGEDLINEKKDYTYDDYAVLIAGKDFKFDYNFCTSEIDEDGEKTTKEYTYDPEDNTWVYTYTDNGSEKRASYSLDIANFLQSCKLSAALLEKSVDSIYKFSASKTGYTITATYKNTEKQIDGEYLFNVEGLITSNSEKLTNLQTVKATTKTITYTYSTK